MKLDLKEKIGQLIIAHLDGNIPLTSDAFHSAVQLIENHVLGGFIVFGGDHFHTPCLIHELQKRSQLPLFFASDMENGVGQQLKGATEFPSNMALGATRSEELAFEEGKSIAREAKALGFNLIFAPVMDVNTNPKNPIINTRSYGDQPDLVSRLGTSFIQGVQEENIIATAKHFPGHGHTELDSHLTLPVVKLSKELLYKTALPPFISAIKHGVQAIMVAHLYSPALDKQTMIPTSLSYEVVNNLLGRKLSFKGLIITDSLRMRGLTDYLPEEKAAVFALKAGVNILLHPADPEGLIYYVYQEAIKDNLLAERVDHAASKINEAKNRLHQSYQIPIPDPVPSLVLAQKIARSSITLIKDDENMIPLNAHFPPELLIIQNNPAAARGEILDNEFKKRIPGIKAFFFPPEWKGVFPELNTETPTICAIFSHIRAYQNALLPSSMIKKQLYKLLEERKSICMIYFGNPYLISEFSQAPCSLCTFSDSAVSQKAVVEALFGEISMNGTLPISLQKRR